jgi:hypothetical protein
MALRKARGFKLGKPICPYAGCWSPEEPCMGACQRRGKEEFTKHPRCESGCRNTPPCTTFCVWMPQKCSSNGDARPDSGELNGKS